ncbi:ArsR/SmtB family transcription factor [Ferrimonas balearica]|uniref:ArsR/SmtB family transcription factor n=1 Tax=Ferrimonas balearica TaxID=44012 RepID=UPI001C99A964|nr:metalloregulator ArsR/SmtB family transcription factor [Ferrimonas balearica]MBY5923487.1 metalloregulator ArsR/SmtB family transcription factor [Ferrimonas balearica]MBY5997866.1 metalloregulator ArsR/SmtB family transcription factor [Ferrimonas balearica]
MTSEFDIADMADNAEAASRLLKSIANGHRLMILCLLLDKELTVGELNDQVPLSQSALSQHLAVLRKEGLVTTRKEAQMVWYQLASPEVEAILSTLHKIYCAPAES